MRVTENSTHGVVRDSLHRSRLRMSHLQKENATLKRINTPSDDPTGNIKLMSIRNESTENNQFEANANLAKTFLNYTDSALEEVTNLLVRAKDLALGQSNTAANSQESRLMVAEEVRNLIDQMHSIANRRLGERYVFAGYKTNDQPFDAQGNYLGDDGKIMVEVQKDVFVGMNLPGREIFNGQIPNFAREIASANGHEIKEDGSVAQRGVGDPPPPGAREIASDSGNKPSEDLFKALDALRIGLMTNDVDMIRATLEPLDRLRDRVVTARAQVGSRIQGIENSMQNMARAKVFNSELSSSIEDADLIQVVSDMAKEETVLRASLQASNKLVQPTLLDFLR
ncbi:MAG: flagellar hook-associated protein FlgL [Bdellovibrionales bacterium]|nr:flagellar hook-associated protein FlgL [Bdellovibrionales bacterium]